MKCRALLFATCFAALFLQCGVARTDAAPYLRQAGPMVGHVSDSTAVVWVRVKLGAVVEAMARQDAETFAPSEVEDLGQGFYRIHFAGLRPAAATSVTLSIKRHGDETETEKLAFATAPESSSTGTVRLAFGSCSKVSQFGKAPIYQAVADEKPDFFIFGGDNVYFIVGDGSDRHFGTTGPTGDWDFHETMLARHLVTRINPDLDRMLRSVPSYAVWDDHDFGPNNADSMFPMKEEATLAFKQMWANPDYGTKETGGIYSSFRHGPVEVFLMDDRSFKYSHFRHEDVTRETGRIWGDAQLTWLLAGLRASTAPVKLIANGTQFLAMESDTAEGHYQEALNERERLLSFLARERIGGVVFLTGDRHHSVVNQLEQDDGTLVLDFTSSPLQQNQQIRSRAVNHPNQLWRMGGNSYGLVTINIPEEGSGIIRFEARDEENRVPVIEGSARQASWRLDQLHY